MFQQQLLECVFRDFTTTTSEMTLGQEQCNDAVETYVISFELQRGKG